MRIATWNVNSVKQRLPRLLPWLDERRPDVVCLQETKLADDAFAGLLGAELAQRGYEVALHGEATWNRVAILSRAALQAPVTRGRGCPAGTWGCGSAAPSRAPGSRAGFGGPGSPARLAGARGPAIPRPPSSTSRRRRRGTSVPSCPRRRRPRGGAAPSRSC